jgi:hypothetical protein
MATTAASVPNLFIFSFITFDITYRVHTSGWIANNVATHGPGLMLPPFEQHLQLIFGNETVTGHRQDTTFVIIRIAHPLRRPQLINRMPVGEYDDQHRTM